MNLKKRMIAIERRVDKLERKRLTVSRSHVTQAVEQAMIKAAERSITEQLRRQGLPITSIEWTTPCQLGNVTWTEELFYSSNGTPIHWVD